jgi:hypothetical protein
MENKISDDKAYCEGSDVCKLLISTRESLSALQEQVRFKSMNVFKPKEDLLQDYLVIYDDDEIAVATYMNAANPEDCFWYAGSEINNIRPYGWMELPLPLPPEEK